MNSFSIHARLLFIILLIGLGLRLAFMATTAPLAPLSSGGDSRWLLFNGAVLVSPHTVATVYLDADDRVVVSPDGAIADDGRAAMPVDVSRLPTPPLYPAFVGGWQHLFSLPVSIRIIQGVQAVMGVLVCALAYRMTTHLASPLAGLIAAGALALSPAYVVESAQILTESLYIFLLMGGMAAYLEWAVDDAASGRWLLASAVLFGLATLTRAVLLVFPLGIVLHAVIVIRRDNWRRRLGWAIVLVLVYSAVVGAWSLYTWQQHQRIVIASDQFVPAMWRGAVTTDGSPQQNDDLLEGSSAEEQVQDVITSDPLGYGLRRLNELTASVAQPHGTVSFGDESIKARVQSWIDSGFTPQVLRAVVTAEGFIIKLLMYVWHYTSLVGAVIGAALAWRRWRLVLVPVGFIAYTTLVHLVLLALPRYLFPMHPILWCLAAIPLAALLARRSSGTHTDVPRTSAP